MDIKILISCFEVPGQGGASTSAYSLFKMMKKDAYDVHYLNIISPEDSDYYKYIYGDRYGNPESLSNVHNCILSKKLFHPSPIHQELIEILNDINPDVVLGVHFISSLLIKKAIPEKPLVFFISNFSHETGFLYNKNTNSLEKLLLRIKNDNIEINLNNPREEQAVKSSDYVIAHSETTRQLFKYIYPSFAGKIYPDVIWMAEWIYNDAFEYRGLEKNFTDRTIDIVFVASSWTRPEKNQELMSHLAESFISKNVHVVGEVRKENRIAGITYHGIVGQRDALFEILADSKCLVSTSRFDAAPGVLFEGSALGCNIVASKNCGNWQICNNNLLVTNYYSKEYTDKIRLALNAKYDDNMYFFLKTNSYKNLKNILDVVGLK